MNKIRELEELLGLRESSRKSKEHPRITITDLEKVEKQLKIYKIKGVNGNSPRRRITQTQSVLRGFSRQIRIQGIDGFGYREFMQFIREQILKLTTYDGHLILNCEMTRQEIFDENNIEIPTFSNLSDRKSRGDQ